MGLRPADMVPIDDVLALKADGFTTPQIAKRLGFSVSGVQGALNRLARTAARPTVTTLIGDAPPLTEDTPCSGHSDVWDGIRWSNGTVLNPDTLLEAMRGCGECPLVQWQRCDTWARRQEHGEFVAAGRLFVNGRPRTEATRRALRAAVGEHAAAHVMSKATHAEETS